MPRNYQNGKIYKLVNSVDDKLYVGSTTAQLSKRKAWHKDKAKRMPQTRVYDHLNTVGWSNVRIILVERYACDNHEELLAREQSWMDELKPELNMINAVGQCEHGRDRYRCKMCNGGSICNHGRRRDGCKDCKGSQICNHGRQRSRCKYCDANTTKKIQCECGAWMRRDNLKRHRNTTRHIRNFIWC